MSFQPLCHHLRVLLGALILLAAALVVGCQENTIPVAPDVVHDTEIAAKKPSGGGGTSLVGEVVEGEGLAGSITSTCAVASGAPGWHINFEHTGCLIVTPVGSSYSLTDDVILIVTKEKGKNGRITHIRLRGQDIIGEDGILHETDELPVAVPVVPDKNGFTLHVHAQDVAVWRLSGHTGGDRVEVIGSVSIGDLVYFVP